MLLLQAFILWLIVSTLLIGGAILFHRQYPKESPWFGFILPPLALVLLFNFIEHLVALPVLLILLPVMLGGTIWMIVAKGWFAEPLILPSIVFLSAFAFTFGIRCLQPNIAFTSDGISDLNMVNNFYQGQTLPPPDSWMPPFKFEWYYDLQHYAASVVGRILDIKVGVAYNVSHALLSTLICVAGAGAAHRISGGKIWVTLAVPFLIESAMTGSTAYLFLFCNNPGEFMSADLSGGMTTPPDGNPLWKWLLWDPREAISHLTTPTTLRLQVPGFWTWRDEYHANASGHFLTVLAVLVIAELTALQRTIWPWVLAVVIPMLAVITSAWALPITVLLCWGILPIALVASRRPASISMALLILIGALTLLWPAFYNATSSQYSPAISPINPAERAPVLEFLLQWWPILVLWVCAWAWLKDVSFGLRWVMIVIPIMFLLIENVTIESRYNMIEKMWGYTWAAGLIALFPFVAARKGLIKWVVVIPLIFSGIISISVFLQSRWHWSSYSNMFHLDGANYLVADEQKKKMLNIVSQVKRATFLSGKCAFCYNEAPALAVFTGNKSYIAWSWFESLTNYQTEADYREKLNNDFYSGALPNRLKFLQANNIAGVLIWPDDDIQNDTLDKLRSELEPTYEYIDCRGSGDKNAGVFLARPLPVN